MPQWLGDLPHRLLFLSWIFSHPSDASRLQVCEQRRATAGGLY
jgi:hypothetical protein